MKTVYLSLGSNMGDREAMLQAALRALESPRLHVRRVSPIYETEPMDVPGQHWFLNLVAEAADGSVPAAIAAPHQQDRGPARPPPPGAQGAAHHRHRYPVVWECGCHHAALELPHPRFRSRRFVLAPLADLAPDLRDPVTRRTVKRIAGELQGQTVREYVR